MSDMSALPRHRLPQFEPEGDLLTLQLGPQHPSTHGVLRLKLVLDGELIVEAVPYLGYLHRGVEKLCERLAYVQLTPIVDKNDYISPMANEQALVMAFERLLQIEVPKRARHLRALLGELQRLASHLLWLGTFALDLGGALGGGSTAFMHCFRERERFLDLFEALTGARFHYNTHTIGGNRHDVPAGWADEVKQLLALVEARMPEYRGMTIDSSIFTTRTRGVGVLAADLALALGVSGPNLRASGVDHDLRRDQQYHIFDELPVRVVTDTGGDCLARTRVRLGEIDESVRLCRELVDSLPAGPLCGARPVKQPGQVKIPTGQGYAALESPRGELGTYVIATGGSSAYRLKLRTPSFNALAALPHILPGTSVSDAIAILGSLDPIMGEVDR
jgi:NADH-quinone oxidoreductase subunit D